MLVLKEDYLITLKIGINYICVYTWQEGNAFSYIENKTFILEKIKGNVLDKSLEM
jgi:hypothetical protein